MAGIDENTGVYIIGTGPENRTDRPDRTTVKNRVVAVDGPRPCLDPGYSVEEGAFVAPVAAGVLLSYLSEGGTEQAVLAYKRRLDKKKALDEKWRSFYNSGKGDGNFRFSIGSPGVGINSFISALYWGLIERGDNCTNALTFVVLFVHLKGRECRTPFWLGTKQVKFDAEKQVFNFEAVIYARNDILDYSDDYPWEIIVKGHFSKGSEEGEIQIVDYRDPRKRE